MTAADRPEMEQAARNLIENLNTRLEKVRPSESPHFRAALSARAAIYRQRSEAWRALVEALPGPYDSVILQALLLAEAHDQDRADHLNETRKSLDRQAGEQEASAEIERGDISTHGDVDAFFDDLKSSAPDGGD